MIETRGTTEDGDQWCWDLLKIWKMGLNKENLGSFDTF